jgi:ABC-type lipoprotein release transport system permease subunit
MILLSLKNITRKKSRSLLIFILSVIAAFNIFYQTAQKNSVQSSLKKLIGEAISGQYIIYDSEKKINVLESQFSDLKLFDWNENQESLLKNKVKEIRDVSPRLRFGGMLSSGDESIGINLQALTEEHLERVSSILDFESGSKPETNDQIMLSKTFAEELESQVGDTIVVLANNRNGYLSDDLLVISGIFKTNGLAQFLVPIGYTHYEKGRTLMGLEDDETMELLINLENFEDTPTNDKLIRAEVSKLNGQLDVATWKESSPLLNSILAIWVNFGYIIKLIFIVFCFLILINIIVMITNNRKKEIGTLLAFGFSPFKVINTIAFEYIFLVVSAVLWIGIVLKLVFDLFLQGGIPVPVEELQAAYLSSKIVPQISWIDIMEVCFLFALACYSAVLISLRKLPKTEITTLLRTST